MIYPDPCLHAVIPADLVAMPRRPQPIGITVDRTTSRVLLELGSRPAGLAALNPTATRSLIDNLDLGHPGEIRLPALGRGLAPVFLSSTVQPGLGVDLAVLGDHALRGRWRVGRDEVPRLIITLVDAIHLVDPYPLPAMVEPPRRPADSRTERRRPDITGRRQTLRILRAGR
ncbi:hypothetical protein [Actinoalloteichus hymeniacidonis]|uniref:Uncharacterized protein n=1 Tax=Actinoalloteichus hymeniacidonis TaxID=340345 RepID=A0AAC9HME4_9PSEU|nr:hypothetical protein [Actinoalloteichus hymeniacidonis]AOS61984.1 hypothetical protein TL08_05795 [Actinoalloteichus hymeniacidonis]MBB5909994.1 hypothetical protein [Actinoalloteichus hymeniacidonis]